MEEEVEGWRDEEEWGAAGEGGGREELVKPVFKLELHHTKIFVEEKYRPINIFSTWKRTDE